MKIEVPVTAEEAQYLSIAAVRIGMDLPNYLYRVAVDQANAENQRLASSGNVSVPQLPWTRR